MTEKPRASLTFNVAVTKNERPGFGSRSMHGSDDYADDERIARTVALALQRIPIYHPTELRLDVHHASVHFSVDGADGCDDLLAAVIAALDEALPDPMDRAGIRWAAEVRAWRP